MSKFIIEENLWEIMQPLLPKKKATGRPRFDDYKIMNGIFYLLRTGCQWGALPNCFGKNQQYMVDLLNWLTWVF